MIEIMLLRRDLPALRRLCCVRMRQPGDLWCLVEITARDLQFLQAKDFWYEIA